MANRFPLIANPSSNQIQELSVSDNLDLTNNSIVGVQSVTAGLYYGNGSNLTGITTNGVTNGKAIAFSMVFG
jgi:hypothetical protein